MSPTDGAAAPSNGAKGSPTMERLARRTKERLRQSLRSIVTLVVLLVIAWSASFYFYATNRLDYLTGRALRELAALGTRTDNALSSALGILQLPRLDAAKIFESADLSPVFRHLNVRMDTIRDTMPEVIKAQATYRPGWSARHCVPDSAFDAHPGFHRDTQAQLSSSCLQTGFSFWLMRAKDSVEVRGNAGVNVATLLDAVFKYPVNARVFELVVLADTGGHILLQTGPLPLRLGRLDGLPAETDPAGKSAQNQGGGWEALRFRPTIMDVRLAGSTFRLFQAPCCLSSAGTWNDRPLVVAGLVRKSSFLLQGLKLPLSLMMVLAAVLVIAVLAWPFLKFGLIGERQRIRPSDGLKLGASSLLAAALLTVFALAFYGYHQYRDQRDHELEQFADRLSSRFTSEIVRAHDQLASLVEWAEKQGENGGFPKLQDSLKASPDSGLIRFPLFESFALIDSSGFQKRKWSTDSLVQPLVRVQHRRYFQDPRNRRTRSLVVRRPSSQLDTLRFALEPVRSLTTGKHEAVLAIRTEASLPVAALALDMVSVVGTTLPLGVGFAVIDDEGLVLFHADETRNLEENFFIETNQNRHLRSALRARSAGHMTLTYAGGDYRAYVSPLSGVPWTLVTFRDMQPGRVVSAEWVLSTSFLILVYLLILLLLTGLVVLFVPSTRLAALWPDRRQRQTYVELTGIFLILAAGFVLAIVGLAGGPLLLASLLLPLLAIVLAVLRLQARGAIRRMIRDRRPGILVLLLSASLLIAGLGIIAVWSHADPVIRAMMVVLAASAGLLAMTPAIAPMLRFQAGMVPAYRSAALLLLLLIGALPAAGFFKVTHAVHGEALVKYQQVKLSDALRRPGPARCRNVSNSLCVPDRYLTALGLRIARNSPVAGQATERSGSALVRRLLPPVRLESSVEWADMHDDTATDGSREWTVEAGTLRLTPPLGDNARISVASTIPSLAGGDSHWWLLVLVTGLAGLVIWWIVRFVALHLFVADMTHPVIVATGNRLVLSADTNLLLLCRDCEEENRLQFSEHFAALDMSQPAWETDEELGRIGQSVAEGRPVVLRHFEHHRHDPVRAETTLRLVDRLVRKSAATVVLVESREPDGGPLGLGREWNTVLPLPGEATAGQAVLESFVLVDGGRWANGESAEPDRRGAHVPRAGSTRAQQLVAEECRGDRILAEVWKGLACAFELAEQQGNPPALGEMLDLLGEKAEAYYDDIWTSCRPSERVVLGHLAQDGLVNAKDWRVLRRLLARGLVRRDPQFRVLNETFRRYLVRHVETAETELGADFKSVWDNVKGPLVAVVATAIIVLLVTQQGLFNATTNVVMGLSSGIPAFAQVVEFISGRKQAAIA